MSHAGLITPPASLPIDAWSIWAVPITTTASSSVPSSSPVTDNSTTTVSPAMVVRPLASTNRTGEFREVRTPITSLFKVSGSRGGGIPAAV